MTKAQFVRSQPMTMPLAEVVALAKKEGLVITNNQVSAYRSQKRAKLRKKRNGLAPSRGKRGAAWGADIEEQFILLVANIGVSRAMELLAKIEQAFR